MRITDFDVYKDLLKEKSGLVLTPNKTYMLDSRLGPIAKKWGYPSLEAMTLALQGVPDKQLVNDVVEAMTINETSFFRDTHPFDYFSDAILPYLEKARARQRKIRIWCAAASTGQEPYSLAMTLKETQPRRPGWKTDILATDISNEVLEQARIGLYSQLEVQRGLPVTLLLKYFAQNDKKWQLHKDICKMVRFETFNLLSSMKGKGPFDVIMCRNVLMYFDQPTRQKILENLAGELAGDGFLILGEDEEQLEIPEIFKPLPGFKNTLIHADSTLTGELSPDEDRAALASGRVSS